MKFITHNDEHVNVNGTHLQGYIKTDYSKLRAMLGEQRVVGGQLFDGHKTDWSWDIEFEDGTVATVYNWKNGPNYGYQGVTPDDVTEWHVGGHTPQALGNVQRLLDS